MGKKLIYFLLAIVFFVSCRTTREITRTETEVRATELSESKDSVLHRTEKHFTDSVLMNVFLRDSVIVTQKDSTVVFVVTDSTDKELSRVVERFFMRDRDRFVLAGNETKESTLRTQAETTNSYHSDSHVIDSSTAMTHWSEKEHEQKSSFADRVGGYVKNVVSLVGFLAIIFLCYIYKRGRV